MTAFSYRAKDKSGEIKSGTIDAASVVKAAEALHGAGLTVLDLAPEAKGGFNIDQYLSFLNHVSKKEIVIFSRQLATLINAKVPIIQAFEILLSQITNRALKNAIAEMMNDIEGGKSLSEAVAVFPHIFSDLYVNLVKSGELSGTLDQSLVYLANQQEKDYELTSKIRGAMTYPIFIVCALVGVGLVMMIVVVPKLTAILTETGGSLPMTTQILISVSGFLKNYWYVILILIIIAVFGIRYSTRTKGGKRFWDGFVLRIPIFGQLFRKIYLVRFTRSLATLSSGGIHLVEALKITSEVVGNRVYRDILERTIKEVEEGNQIASVLIKSKDVPPMVSYMVSVGEQTGKLDVVLSKLSDFYSREIDNLVVNLVSLIEPIIMLVLGLAVGVMVAAIIMPMYNLASAL